MPNLNIWRLLNHCELKGLLIHFRTIKKRRDTRPLSKVLLLENVHLFLSDIINFVAVEQEVLTVGVMNNDAPSLPSKRPREEDIAEIASSSADAQHQEVGKVPLIFVFFQVQR